VARQDDIQSCIQQIIELAANEGDLLEIYVGVPINLKGSATESTEDAILFAESLAAIANIEVLLIDERLTTSIANSQLLAIGKSQKSARSTIDQMAAVAILEYALSVERNSGQRPGLTVTDWRAKHE
jgi:putative Holliday junction resolvase